MAVAEARVERLATGPQKPIPEARRFGMMAIGAYGCICTSLRYAFNLISGPLQQKYNLSGRDVTTISTVGLVFCYFMLPYGFLYDHFGPRPIFLLAITLFPLGALLLSLCFSGAIEGNVLKLSVFNAILNVGCSLFDLACMVTVMSLFPSNRGAVVAIMKSYIGLGSAIVGCIQLTFFNGRPDYYFYFLMGLVFVSGLLCFLFVRLPSYHLTGYEQNHLDDAEKERRAARKSVYLRQKPPRIRFIVGFIFVFALIIFLPIQSALIAYMNLGQSYRYGFTAVVIALVLTYPIMALPFSCMESKKKEEVEFTPIEGNHEECASQKKRDEKAPVETDVDYIAPQYQTTFFQNLLTVKMWTLFWTYFCVVGSELVIIHNARFIMEALSGEPVSSELNTLLTVLNGVGSAIGRLLMSVFEVWTQKRKAENRIPITMALFLPVVSVMFAIILFLVLPKVALPLPYVMAAMGNGFCAAVIILIARTIFAKDPAKHYNFCFLATMSSIILLNRLTYGEWYTRQAEKAGTTTCRGKNCVMMPFLLFLGLNCSAFFTIIYLNYDYRRFCLSVLEERRRLAEEEDMPVMADESDYPLIGQNISREDDPSYTCREPIGKKEA